MDGSRHIKLLYLLIISMCCLQLYIASISLGGTDIEVYWKSPYAIDSSNFYYTKELLSWSIISEISSNSSREYFLLNISIVIFAVSLLFLGFNRGALLYAAFLSPFGILLSLNVLRQGFATALLAVALFRVSERNLKHAAVLSILALFCHNFSIVIILSVGFAYVFLKLKNEHRFIMAALAIFTFLMLAATGWISFLLDERSNFDKFQTGGNFQNIIYLGFATSITTALFFFVPKYKAASAGMLFGMISFAFIIFLFDLNYWTFGRIAISVCVISTFLCFESFVNNPYLSRVLSLLVYFLVVIEPLLILFHPGAMSMIG